MLHRCLFDEFECVLHYHDKDIMVNHTEYDEEEKELIAHFGDDDDQELDLLVLTENDFRLASYQGDGTFTVQKNNETIGVEFVRSVTNEEMYSYINKINGRE